MVSLDKDNDMNKTRIKQIKDKTLRKKELVADHLDARALKRAWAFCEPYKAFLNQAKTERKAAREIIRAASEKGFESMDKALARTPGSVNRVFRIFQDRCAALAVIGKKPIHQGVNMIASHIDSPRLDLKQNPVYEDLDLGLIKTHYYGGIRKYHWLALPMALHGVVQTTDQGPVEITLGEDPRDPVLTITDLLPHLAGKLQSGKTLADAFDGEKLNLIAGSLPLGGKDDKDRVKLGLLNFFNETYGLVEEDFISAEIEAVPAGPARDVGLDRSMIGAYGQDDRICAYTALQAVLDRTDPEKTAVAFFFDKEEIGSEGSSGAQSSFFKDFMADLMTLAGLDADSRTLRKALMASSCLSADVNAAMDPDFKEVHEAMNAAKLGYGPCLTKFTGVAGKSGSSDAGSEFLGRIRKVFNQNRIVWQTGELGRIDQGGGGTVAKFLSRYGMDVLDCGPALLSMHSPFEIAAKVDVYMTYLAYSAFYADHE